MQASAFINQPKGVSSDLSEKTQATRHGDHLPSPGFYLTPPLVASHLLQPRHPLPVHILAAGQMVKVCAFERHLQGAEFSAECHKLMVGTSTTTDRDRCTNHRRNCKTHGNPASEGPASSTHRLQSFPLTLSTRISLHVRIQRRQLVRQGVQRLRRRSHHPLRAGRSGGSGRSDRSG